MTVSPSLDDALAGAERLLSRRAGATVHLTEPEDLGGHGESVVVRTRMTHNPFSDRRSVVVKQYLGSDDGVDPFRYEVASCQLFTALPADARPAPVIIAHDPDQRLLVLEDLGRSGSLADKLFGPDPETATRCLLSWARALGRMQACTAGREDDFGALLRRLGERVRRDPIADQARAALAEVPALVADVLGVTVPPQAAVEARTTARLLGGTRFRAFSTADTCPDNNLVTSLGVRFVDFERGCFRDVALDAAYFRVPFPACPSSFALPDGMSAQMLAAWRSEVAGVWPELDDTGLLEPRLVDADVLWVWWCTWTLLPRLAHRDGPLGRDAGRTPWLSTALRHYWYGLGERAAATLPATTGLAGLMTAAIDERFPDSPRVLPVFPAFRARV
ncbi:hypothetical protein [Pseudonocardia endophytica]|uniref:Phosphotransferase family enzyme n=1 Tax=Pseudonocardia endophytica TaxID=401976 RepID=A0A4R1HQG2_PSEEN|nr:hypothetical protein [Pseudonocardia endophytica]TCK22710.1 hypothetical protein EV378_6718 [Pseudonocardia endophytica]